jgi:phenylacetate-CoA ligase
VLSNSAFYQDKFKAAGLERGDIKTVHDLSKIPFTLKDEIRQSQEKSPPLGQHMTCRWEKVRRIYSSSGTSGRPTYIGLSHHDYDNVWMQIAPRSYYCSGFRPGHQVVLTVNIGPFIAGSELDSIERIGCTTVPLGSGNTERVISSFQLGANALLATPSYVQYIIKWCDDRGIDKHGLGLKKIAVSGEPGAGIPAVRNKMQAAFDAEVTETAGLSDISVSCWGECQYQCGMHFCAQEFVILELINPETGENLELKDGARGELVYTAIDRECVPLLRFRSRDHVELYASQCDCGRTSPRIRIIGRTDDMLIVQGVNVFPTAIKAVVTQFKPRTSGEIEVQLKEPGPSAKAPLPIKVEHTSQPGDLNKLKGQVEQALREKLVFRAEVELVPEGTLPRYEYKGKLVRKLYEREQI